MLEQLTAIEDHNSPTINAAMAYSKCQGLEEETMKMDGVIVVQHSECT